MFVLSKERCPLEARKNHFGWNGRASWRVASLNSMYEISQVLSLPQGVVLSREKGQPLAKHNMSILPELLLRCYAFLKRDFDLLTKRPPINLAGKERAGLIQITHPNLTTSRLDKKCVQQSLLEVPSSKLCCTHPLFYCRLNMKRPTMPRRK